jgi:polysaccharide biosynthesis protein PslH
VTRVLYLTHMPPLPPASGDRIRSFNVLRQLRARGWHTTLFSLSSAGSHPAPESDYESLCDRVLLAPIQRLKAQRLMGAASLALRRRAFHEEYFFDRNARVRLDALAGEDFDLVLAATLYVLAYVPQHLKHRLVLDTINVETRRLEAMARGALGPRSFAARLQVGPTRKLEEEAARRALRVLAVSKSEKAFFERVAPGRVDLVPNGIAVCEYAWRSRPVHEPALLFIGSLNYSANVDAVLYLLRSIVPRLRRLDATLSVVGLSPPAAVVGAARRSPLATEVTGYVPSAAPHFQRARMVVVPLRYGGGTRLKILEALAHGVPVVSTTIGAEGLGVRHEREVLLADDAASFAREIDRLLEDDALAARLATAGRQLVERRFDWHQIGHDLSAALSRALDAA